MFEILVDDHKFYLSAKSLQNYPDSILTKVASASFEYHDPRIFKDHDKIYVDADYKTFSHIISHIRGYNTDLTEFNYDAVRNIKRDAEYFGFTQLYDELSTKYIGGGTVEMQNMDTDTDTGMYTDSTPDDLEEINLGNLGVEYDLDRDDEIDEEAYALLQQQLMQFGSMGSQSHISNTSEPVTTDLGGNSEFTAIDTPNGSTDLASFSNNPTIMQIVQEANARDTESDIDEDMPQLTPNYISLS